jgi:hypothetical protein
VGLLVSEIADVERGIFKLPPFRRPFPLATRHTRPARAALEQRFPGQSGLIEYEDASGRRHDEEESGDDPPDTDVKDCRFGLEKR